MRQTRRPPISRDAGLGVDRYGGPVIDPTENVLSLVDVEKTHQRYVREIDEKHLADLRRTDTQWSQRLHDAEQRRLDDLRLLNRQLMEQANKYQDDARVADKLSQKTIDDIRVNCEHRLGEMAAVHLKEQSSLLAVQLDRFTSALGTRIGELERFRYEITGKTTGRSDVLSYAVALLSIIIAAAALLWRSH